MLRLLLVLATIVTVGGGALAAEEKKNDETGYRIEKDISYLPEGKEATPYQLERCRLDLYCPDNKPGFATVVWFHGG